MIMRLVLTAFALIAPMSAFAAPAAKYNLLAPLGNLSGAVTLSEYLQGILIVVIGLAGLLAVVMIVICGVRMVAAPSAGEKTAAKDCIRNALFGVLLAASSWIILNTINTDLLKNTSQLFSLPAPTPGIPGTPPPGNYYLSDNGTCTPQPGMIVSVAPPSYCAAGAPGQACCSSIASPLTPPSGTPGAPIIPPWSFDLPPISPPGTIDPNAPPKPLPTPLPKPTPTPTPVPVWDTASPYVLIKRPAITGYVVTTGTLNVGFTITEDTALDSVIISVESYPSGVNLLTKTYCSSATNKCPLFDVNTTTPINFGAAPAGEYNITVTACDATGNCASKMTRVTLMTGCTSENPACHTDYNALLYCIGLPTTTFGCTKADLNNDGVITIADLGELALAAQYDINKDGVVHPSATSLYTNYGDTCFFHTAQDPLLPCAIRISGNISITQAEKDNFKTMFLASQTGPSSVNISQLDANLCKAFPTCKAPGMGLGGTDQVSVYAEAMFSTLVEYDFNKDGTIDWSLNGPDIAYFEACRLTPTNPSCNNADINRDNYITSSDLNMIRNLQATWTGTLSDLSDMELMFWDAVFQPEAGILTVCKDAVTPLVLLCKAADFNQSGSVDSADITQLGTTAKYDINGDGLVIYGTTPIVPVLITASAPTSYSGTFKLTDRVAATTVVFPRSGAGNAQPLIGNILAGDQGTIVGGPIFVDSKWWWQVAFDGNVTGWITQDYLAIATTPPPTPPAPPPTGLSTKFKMNEVVGSTDTFSIRSGASLSSPVIGSVAPNDWLGNIIGGPIYKDGFWWWQVNWESGRITGWSAQTYMKEYTPPPAPVITVPTKDSYVAMKNVVIKGTMPAAEVDGSVRVSQNGITVGTAIIGTSGAWQLTGSLADGTYTIVAVATDQSLNVGPTSTPVKFTVDTIAPNLPILSSPSGTILSSTILFQGTGSEAGTMYIYDNTPSGTPLGTVSTSGGTNSWSFTKSSVVNGSHTYAIVEHDFADNISPTKFVTIFVAAPPPTPTITAPINGTYFNSSTVTVSGSGSTPGNTIRVYLGTTIIGIAVINSSKTWSVSISGFAQGSSVIQAVQVDAVGVLSAPSTGVSFTVDTIPPSAPLISSPIALTTNITGTVTFSGTASEAGTVYIYDASGATPVLLGTALTSGGSNTWTLTTTNFVNGLHTFTMAERDLAANVGPSASVTITIDAPPPPPTISSPTSNSFVNTPAIVVSGIGALAGNTIQLYSGATLLGSTVVGAGNTWSITTAAFADGTYGLSATEISPTLKISNPSPTTFVTVDTVPPVAPVVTTPTDGSSMKAPPPSIKVSGTGSTAGNTITLFSGATTIGTTQVSGSLTWTLNIGTFGLPGSYTITVTEKDKAGNVSTPPTSLTVTLT